jgi:hypothetical protein
MWGFWEACAQRAGGASCYKYKKLYLYRGSQLSEHSIQPPISPAGIPQPQITIILPSQVGKQAEILASKR